MPNIDKAADLVGNADFVIVVGSSMQVYPAAGLVAFADVHVPVWYVDPKPAINYELRRRANLTIIEQSAALGVPLLVRELLEQG